MIFLYYVGIVYENINSIRHMEIHNTCKYLCMYLDLSITFKQALKYCWFLVTKFYYITITSSINLKQ